MLRFGAPPGGAWGHQKEIIQIPGRLLQHTQTHTTASMYNVWFFYIYLAPAPTAELHSCGNSLCFLPMTRNCASFYAQVQSIINVVSIFPIWSIILLATLWAVGDSWPWIKIVMRPLSYIFSLNHLLLCLFTFSITWETWAKWINCWMLPVASNAHMLLFFFNSSRVAFFLRNA